VTAGTEHYDAAHYDATSETSKGLSQHFPIPVAILARLAVDADRLSHGIGGEEWDFGSPTPPRAAGLYAFSASGRQLAAVAG
jgi:hypothetical protein